MPWLTDADISLFEHGAILLHLGERSGTLMSSGPCGRTATPEWLFVALNSVEMRSVPWSLFQFAGDATVTSGRKHLDEFLHSRLQHMQRVLAGHGWLAEAFTIAAIDMADVLRSSTGWGSPAIPLVADMSRALPSARRSLGRMRTRSRISLRRTEEPFSLEADNRPCADPGRRAIVCFPRPARLFRHHSEAAISLDLHSPKFGVYVPRTIPCGSMSAVGGCE